MLVVSVITGLQVKAAMAVLGWSGSKLKEKSGIGTTVITLIRKEDGVKESVKHGSLRKLRDALNEGLSEKGLELDDKHIFRAKEGE